MPLSAKLCCFFTISAVSYFKVLPFILETQFSMSVNSWGLPERSVDAFREVFPAVKTRTRAKRVKVAEIEKRFYYFCSMHWNWQSWLWKLFSSTLRALGRTLLHLAEIWFLPSRKCWPITRLLWHNFRCFQSVFEFTSRYFWQCIIGSIPNVDSLIM